MAKKQFWANFDILGAPAPTPFTDEGQIWCVIAAQGLYLLAKFHLNVFIVSASGGQKPQFWANFYISGDSCTDPLSPMRAKFGAL